MLRAKDISLYKLMTSGYISPETYKSLNSKKYFFELRKYDISADNNISRDINNLLNDSVSLKHIAYLEQLDKDLSKEETVPYDILNKFLNYYKNSILDVINLFIKQKNFLLNYVYCTDEVLYELPYITPHNTPFIKKLIREFRYAYESHCDGYVVFYGNNDFYNADLETSDDPSDTIIENTKIEINNDYNDSPVLKLDPDFLSPLYIDCKRYVLFINSLSKEDFRPVRDYIMTLLSKMPVRASNCIKSLGIREFIVNYLYADSVKLLKIRNLGRKSIYDIDNIRPYITGYINNLYQNANTDAIERIIDKEEQLLYPDKKTLRETIGEIKYILLSSELDKLTLNLSVRSKNALKTYKGDFLEDFVYRNNDILHIRNVGKRSELELSELVDKLKEYLLAIANEDFDDKKLTLYIKRTDYGDCFDDFVETYYLENNHFPMFYVLEKQIKENITNNRDFQIFNLFTPFFKDETPLSLDEIGDMLNISRERARQIYVKTNSRFHRFLNKADNLQDLNIWKILSNTDDWKYIEDYVEDQDCIDIYALANTINDKEKTDYNDSFIFIIVSVLLEDMFSLVGKDSNLDQANTERDWANSYFIKRGYAEKFDFNYFFKLIEEYEENNVEDLVVTTQEMILDTFILAWKDFDTNMVVAISDIVSTMLIQELGMVPDDNFRFVIKGKKKEKTENIIYEILSSKGQPISIVDLYEQINQLFPNRYKSPESLRGVIFNDPRMCFIGKTKHVGLYEWEHIHIGSIRNIIIQFLSEKDRPQSLSSIYKYVIKYRKTSENSIRSSMLSGDSFIKLDRGLWGLKNKKYNSIKKSPNQEVKYKPNEDKRKNVLREDDSSDLDYNIPYKRKSWFDLCKEYQEFLDRYERKPSKYSTYELKLFKWFKKSQDDFKNGLLDSDKEKMFLTLCKYL